MKNANNINIADGIQNLPTNQNSVVNAIISAIIDNYPEVYNRIFQDKHYNASQLSIIICYK